MKNKVLIIILAFMIFIPTVIMSSTYHTKSSSSIINSDGTSSSKSELSSPIGGQISFGKFVSLSKGDNMFRGCVFDGEKTWLVPYSYGKVIYYSKSGESNSLDISDFQKGTALYWGGAFDGKSIYFAPFGADGILQIDAETKQIEKIKLDNTQTKYKGAQFDGENTWFFPSNGKEILKLSSVGEIVKYEIPYDIPTENAFSGGIIVQRKLYLVPDNFNELVILDLTSGNFEKISLDTSSYSGAVTDGNSIWFIPGKSDSVMCFDTKTNENKTIKLPETNIVREFSGGGYDGRFLWLAPLSGSTVIKFDTLRNKYETLTLEKGDESYSGGTFDGESVWLSPSSSDSPLKIKGNNTPPTVMNVFIETYAGTTVESQLTANDSDEGDKLTFTILEEPKYGQVTLDNESGTFIYTAGTNSGEDYFSYYANDLYDESNVATVTIKVTEGETASNGKYIDLWEHWAEDAANYLTETKVLNGEEVDGYQYFYPYVTMNRANFIVWVNSAFGYEGSQNDNTLPFEDTKNAEKWIVNAASAAYQNKVIMGSLQDEKLYFKPYENLSRVEALTIIYNIIKPSHSPETTLDFSDKETFPSWSLDILRALKNAGILKGYDDNTLRLYNSVSRAEAAQMLYETLSIMNKTQKSIQRLK